MRHNNEAATDMSDSSSPSLTTSWMPDLCRAETLFGIALIVEVVVLSSFLLRQSEATQDWLTLSTNSLFAQWLALLCAMSLCKARRWIVQLPPLVGISVALLGTTAMVGFISLLVARIDQELDLGYTVPSANTLRFALTHAGIALILTALGLRYFYVAEQWRRQLAARTQAQMQALQARINPHFLFNSMNSIAALIRHDPRTAEQAVEDLSELFRAALGNEARASSLQEELHLAERYLAIEALRLGPRLQVVWDLDDGLPMNLPLPRLILQPLVENAIVHGIARRAQGGTIRVSAHVEGSVLTIAVCNPLAEQAQVRHGNQHAQESIGLRLSHQFEGRAHMVAGVQCGYYVVTLIILLDAP